MCDFHLGACYNVHCPQACTCAIVVQWLRLLTMWLCWAESPLVPIPLKENLICCNYQLLSVQD